MKRFILVFTMLVMSGLLVACGSESASKSSNEGSQENTDTNSNSDAVTIKFGHSSAPGSARDLGAQKFKEVLEEETDGAFIVELYPANQLGDPTEQVQSVQLGNQDMAIEPSSFLGEFQPLVSLVDIPFLLPPDKEDLLELHNTEAMKNLLDETEEVGIKTLGIWHTGYKQFTGPVPFRTVDDFKGLKFRSMPSPTLMKEIESLGGIPTNIDFSETYNALQTGTIDGQTNPMDTTYDMKFHEVQDYVTMTNHGVLDQFIIVNKAFYDGLEEENKEAFMKAFEAGRQETLEKTYERIDSINEELKASNEIEYIELTEEERNSLIKATEPVRDYYVKEYGEEGEKLLQEIEDAIEGLE